MPSKCLVSLCALTSLRCAVQLVLVTRSRCCHRSNMSDKTQLRRLCAHATDANVQHKDVWVTKRLGISEVILSSNLQQSSVDFYWRSLSMKISTPASQNWDLSWRSTQSKVVFLANAVCKPTDLLLKESEIKQTQAKLVKQVVRFLWDGNIGVERAKTVFLWLRAALLKSIKRNMSVQFCSKQI